MSTACVGTPPLEELLEYLPGFLDRGQADRLFDRLRSELAWARREIRLFGRSVMQPRLVAWYGDPGARYRYSGVTWEPLPWHPALSELRSRLETRTGARFNSVLANGYRDGRDSMGWHSDDEPELGTDPLIASISLGEERRLLFRPGDAAARGPGRTHALQLGHGSLLLMRGACQQRYQHSLPKTRRALGWRINLTFRWVQPQALP